MRTSKHTNKKIVDAETFKLLTVALGEDKVNADYQIENTRSKHVDEASVEIQDQFKAVCKDIAKISNFEVVAKEDTTRYKKGSKLTIGFSNPTVKVTHVNGKKLTYKSEDK